MLTSLKGCPHYVTPHPEKDESSDGLPPGFWEGNAHGNRESEESVLKCILQRSRPQHVSGRPDDLPFRDATQARCIFAEMGLPSSYFQIADGSAGSAQSHTIRDPHGTVSGYELIAHCISKQGDWAIALSHSIPVRQTSVFWSVDSRIDSGLLLTDLHDFQHYALHPMLVPCIMFAGNLRSNEQRRQSIKERIQKLEAAVRRFSSQDSSVTDFDLHTLDGQKQPEELESLFEMLNSCRKDQTSREGRYEFWRNCHEAIDDGFKYTEAWLKDAPDEHMLRAQDELWRWKAVTHRKLESLLARDKDHISRVESISNMVSIPTQMEVWRHTNNVPSCTAQYNSVT